MTPLFDENNEAIQDLPVEIQAALKCYGKTGAEKELNAVILLVLKDLGARLREADFSNETNFITDLDLDSLAISEFVFFFEDVFKIRISNEELLSMRTLGELKLFLSGKLE